MSITVGSEASDRASSVDLYSSHGMYKTYVEGSNPATASGLIRTVQAYFAVADAGNSVKVGTFRNDSNTLTCISAVELGEASLGLNTWTGLSLAIAEGDYIGIDARAAAVIGIDEATTGGGRVWSLVGQYCDPEDSGVLGYNDGYALSLQGVSYASYTSALSVGVAATASRFVEWNRTSPLGLGMALTCLRNTVLGRTSALGVGLSALGDRIFGSARSSALGVGIAAAAKRGFAFTAALGVGFAATAIRDKIGDVLKVFLRPSNPYKVEVAPSDPYKVEVAPPEE